MDQPAAKVCVRCGEDCSKKPRVRDKSGRYMCQACVDAAAGQTAEPALIEDAAAVLDLTQERPPAPAPTRAGAVQDEHYSLSPIVQGEDITKRPSFKAALPKSEPSTCKQCGYDCTGIPAGKPCPECGSTVRKLQRQDTLQDVSDDAAREAITRPLTWMACGLATIAIGLGIWERGWQDFAVAYLTWLVMVPVSLIAFMLARMIFLTYDEEWKAAALQLGATMAVVGGVNALLGGVGIGGGIVSWGTMIFMFMYVMDMEKIEAIGMGVLLIAVQLGIMVGLALLL